MYGPIGATTRAESTIDTVVVVVGRRIVRYCVVVEGGRTKGRRRNPDQRHFSESTTSHTKSKAKAAPQHKSDVALHSGSTAIQTKPPKTTLANPNYLRCRTSLDNLSSGLDSLLATATTIQFQQYILRQHANCSHHRHTKLPMGQRSILLRT